MSEERLTRIEEKLEAFEGRAKAEAEAISHTLGDARQHVFDATEVLRPEMKRGFEDVNQRFGDMDRRFDRLEDKLDRTLATRPRRSPPRRGR